MLQTVTCKVREGRNLLLKTRLWVRRILKCYSECSSVCGPMKWKINMYVFYLQKIFI